MTDNVTLSGKQAQAVALLVGGKDVRTTAAEVGVSERQAGRWMARDDFRTALTAAEAELIATAVRRLVQLQAPAINVIAAVLRDETLGPGLRLRAAQGVIDGLIALRSHSQFEERLTELERRVQDYEQK